ncbi:MAG: GTP-binding protein [Candidatus Korarchaeota archaeon]|nr:GTP-binding protein [Candidatus Korarchaeota archaeon]
MRKMKLVVVGPHQAGKSTLIRRLDPWAVKMDYSKGSFTTTVGFDYGIFLWDATVNRIYRKDQLDEMDPGNEIWKVSLTGTPGQMAFSPVRRVLARGKDGIILILDSSRPVDLVYALSHYQEARESIGPSAPLVILANKQDLPNAKSAETVASLLGIRAKVFPVSALRGTNVEESILYILREVRREVFKRSISERVSAWSR